MAAHIDFMITAWSLLRACLMWMPASAVLAWTAALLLWLNPASLFDAGFLYSFVITAALLLLNERYVGDGRAPDPLPLMPVSPLRRRTARQIRLRSRLIGAAGAAVTAFLGGAVESSDPALKFDAANSSVKGHGGAGAKGYTIFLAIPLSRLGIKELELEGLVGKEIPFDAVFYNAEYNETRYYEGPSRGAKPAGVIALGMPDDTVKP